MRIRFNDFVFDSDRRELSHGTEQIALRPKALELLQILIEARPKAVAQQQLYDRLWPNTFVERTSLHKVLHHLRKALGDRERTIIRSVYGFGFSFSAIAIEEQARPSKTRWEVVIGDREFDLREGENIVGRGRNAASRIDAASISRKHARITVSREQITLEDLGSKSGTSTRGKRIRLNTLSDADTIAFGTVAAAVRVRRICGDSALTLPLGL